MQQLHCCHHHHHHNHHGTNGRPLQQLQPASSTARLQHAAVTSSSSRHGRRTRVAPGRAAASAVSCRAERREYYDFKDMPPLPLTVSRIHVPALGHVVVDRASQAQRQASLAIFYDIFKDDQYAAKLNRRSAITALCMFDRDDVSDARAHPGNFPNIDLLHRVYNEGLELDFVVEEIVPSSGGGGSGGTPS